MKKASITIYFAIILTILIALFVTCIEGARIQATKLKVLYASDAAAVSCFAEYRKELFEKYDLLFVDISYGGGTTDQGILERHVGTIFDENCYPSKNIPVFFHKTVLGVEETSVEINGIQLATDDGGEVFKEAASLYIKSRYGIAELEMLAKQIKSYEDEGYFSGEIEQERIENEREIDEKAVVSKGETEDGEIIWEEVEVENPADEVNNTRKGVLNLVVKQTDLLSDKMVDLSTYASNRKNTIGNLNSDGQENSLGELAMEEIYFSEYVLEKCGNYLLPGESDYLAYECEYVIGGAESDIENLRKVVNQILLIRETSNVAHILADQTKMNELEVLAAGLASVITLPELQPVIKYSLLLAWGYAESVSDVKRMLEGERVAFYKTKEQWKLSLENMLSMEIGENSTSETYVNNDIESSEKSNSGDLGGLEYKDYLRMLIYVEAENKKIFRMMDIVEMNIRSLGYNQFRLDTCANVMDFTFVAIGKNGKTYEEKKRQKY